MLQSSLEKALSAQLKAALRTPLKESFRTSFEQQLLPAFDAACQNLFSQVRPQSILDAAGGAWQVTLMHMVHPKWGPPPLLHMMMQPLQ